MATYDRMSAEERRRLMDVLGSLTGLQDGPDGHLPDGTRYEYDAVLRTTVEVTPTGERFPVVLVDAHSIWMAVPLAEGIRDQRGWDAFVAVHPIEEPFGFLIGPVGTGFHDDLDCVHAPDQFLIDPADETREVD